MTDASTPHPWRKRLSLFHPLGRCLFAAGWIYLGVVSAMGWNAWTRQQWPLTSMQERYTRQRFAEALTMGVIGGPVSFVVTAAMTGWFQDGFLWSFTPDAKAGRP